MEAVPLIIAAGASIFSTISSADQTSQANKIAQQQTQNETDLINQAKQQQGQQIASENASAGQAAQLAARRALAGNSTGFNSTILTGGGNTSVPNGGLITPGKTLLGQ